MVCFIGIKEEKRDFLDISGNRSAFIEKTKNLNVDTIGERLFICGGSHLGAVLRTALTLGNLTVLHN